MTKVWQWSTTYTMWLATYLTGTINKQFLKVSKMYILKALTFCTGPLSKFQIEMELSYALLWG